MGELVRLERRPSSPRTLPADTTATILIFTGVRYERQAVAVPRRPSRPKRKRG